MIQDKDLRHRRENATNMPEREWLQEAHARVDELEVERDEALAEIATVVEITPRLVSAIEVLRANQDSQGVIDELAQVAQVLVCVGRQN